MNLDEEIFELREKGLTYKRIAEELTNQGKKISSNTIRLRCKKIYVRKGKKEPKIRRSKIKDEEIFKLREQGLTYEKIVEELTNQGEKTNISVIYSRCKEIYEEKEMDEPKIRSSKITDEKIFELREQGLTYKKIAEELTNQGEKIDRSVIKARCKKIYEKKRMEEPKAKREQKTKIITDEEIFKLREKGLSYEKISEELTNQGKKISFNTIRLRCKKIYEEKGMEEPKVKRKQKTKITDEEIFKLREKGLSYEKIAEELTNQGKKISSNTIRLRCKKIYEEKGKEEPETKCKQNLQITDEEIFELSEKGLSYRKIAEELANQGKKIDYSTAKLRCKEIYEEKAKTKSKLSKTSEDKSKQNLLYQKKENEDLLISEKELARMILNLTVTRNATIEQVKKIADVYGVDLEKTMNSLEER